MDITQLYKDYNIQYVDKGHKHARPGWINVACPFCTGNPGYHLGYDTVNNKFVCWRCGGKPVLSAISQLLKINKTEAAGVLRKYKGTYISKTKPIKIHRKKFKMPHPLIDFTEAHKRYLKKRKYHVEDITKTWNLKATGIFAMLDKTDYSKRIIIPYHWNGEVVSFDSRDITGKNSRKYIACNKERETIPHKRILYGLQEHWTDVGICVEGPTDVWRMGVKSFAVSGIQYTHAQVRLMAKYFKKIYVLFDPDAQAQRQASKLVSDLQFRGVEAYNIKINTDPGDMKPRQAEKLLKTLC